MNLPLARDWRHRARCRDEDPELFFPVGTSGPALLQIAEAKSVCRRCPVVSECLTFALDSEAQFDVFGVWGGMTEDERDELLRRQRRNREGTADPAPGRRPDPSPLAGRSRRGERVRALAIQQLIKGVPRAAIAREFDVHRRTVERWAARPEVRAHLPQTQAVS